MNITTNDSFYEVYLFSLLLSNSFQNTSMMADRKFHEPSNIHLRLIVDNVPDATDGSALQNSTPRLL